MEEKDTSRNSQHILVQIRLHETPSNWQVFRISRRKLAILSISLCSFTSLTMSLLAWYLLGNPDHHPPVPPDAAHICIVIMIAFIVSAFLLSTTIWITMKNKALILTSDVLVQADSQKLKSTFCIMYRDIAAISLDGYSIFIQDKRKNGRKKQIDCRLFEVSPEVIAHDLLAACENFRMANTPRNARVGSPLSGNAGSDNKS